MAITTYSELQTAISNFSGRSGLTSRLPEFIMLAEQRIKNGSSANGRLVPPLRTRSMQSSATLSTVAGTDTVSLPSGFLELYEKPYIAADPKKILDSTTYSLLRNDYASNASGEPSVFSIYGSLMAFGPTPDAVYSIPILYYSLTPLSDSNTTNSVLTNHPDVYLQASLLELFLYTKATERAAIAFDAYASAVASANMASQSSIYPKTARMRPRVVV